MLVRHAWLHILFQFCVFITWSCSLLCLSEAGKRWHEVSIVGWKNAKCCWWQKRSRKSIYTLYKLVLYNVCEAEKFSFFRAFVLMLRKESLFLKSETFSGLGLIEKDQLCARVQYFLFALLPQCYRLLTEIKLFQILCSQYFCLSLKLPIYSKLLFVM